MRTVNWQDPAGCHIEWHNRGMTERKPRGMAFESWIDRLVREAEERGEFDDLPGAGKPIPDLDQPYDEDWWLKQKVRREGFSTDALLPTSLRLRKEIAALPQNVRELPTERTVRDAVQQLNQRILAWLRRPDGPYVPLRPVNPDDVVAHWRTDRRQRRRRD